MTVHKFKWSYHDFIYFYLLDLALKDLCHVVKQRPIHPESTQSGHVKDAACAACVQGLSLGPGHPKMPSVEGILGGPERPWEPGPCAAKQVPHLSSPFCRICPVVCLHVRLHFSCVL